MKAKAIQVVPVIAAIVVTKGVTSFAKVLANIHAKLFAMAIVMAHAKAIVTMVAPALLTNREPHLR